MRKIAMIALCILLAVSLTGTAYCCIQLRQQNALPQTYVLFIGTNDKDTNTMEHTEEECMEIVDSVCLQYLNGYTLIPASGRWTDDGGQRVTEYTLICYITGAQYETVRDIADQLLVALNQNCILIEQSRIASEYYSGTRAE